jgi:hypothetical protein
VIAYSLSGFYRFHFDAASFSKLLNSDASSSSTLEPKTFSSLAYAILQQPIDRANSARWSCYIVVHDNCRHSCFVLWRSLNVCSADSERVHSLVTRRQEPVLSVRVSVASFLLLSGFALDSWSSGVSFCRVQRTPFTFMSLIGSSQEASYRLRGWNSSKLKRIASLLCGGQ